MTRTRPTLAPASRQQLLITAEEAAQRLSIGRTKVYELIGRGALRSVRIDRSRRIPVDALEEYVRSLRGDLEGVAKTSSGLGGSDLGVHSADGMKRHLEPGEAHLGQLGLPYESNGTQHRSAP